MFGLAVVAVGRSSGDHHDNLPAAQARAVAEAIQAEADQVLHTLAPIASRLRVGEPVDWKQFARLTSEAAGPTMSDGAADGRRLDQRLFAWAPRVTEGARAGYESRTGDDGYRSFRVIELQARAGLVAAGQRPWHLPVHLASPVEQAAALLGLDLAADAELRAAVDRAGRSGQAELLGPRSLGDLPAGTTCPRAARELLCQTALIFVLPVSARGGVNRGVLLASVPWLAIETGANLRSPQAPSASARQAIGLPGALASGATIQPDRPRPPSPLLLPSAARASFYVGDRRWTVDLKVSALAGRTTARRAR